jgi:hypothetical protein
MERLGSAAGFALAVYREPLGSPVLLSSGSREQEECWLWVCLCTVAVAVAVGCWCEDWVGTPSLALAALQDSAQQEKERPGLHQQSCWHRFQPSPGPGHRLWGDAGVATGSCVACLFAAVGAEPSELWHVSLTPQCHFLGERECRKQMTSMD